MPDTSPALPPLTLPTGSAVPPASPRALPPAPVSPDVAVDSTAVVPPAGGWPGDPAIGRVMEAFRLLQVRQARLLAHESASRGLNVTDTRFLVHLGATAGHATTPKQAGDQLELSTGAMTSLLDRLEQRGLLARRPNPGDRRSILVQLTPAGVTVAREVADTWAAVFGAAIAPADRTAVASAFEAIGASLDRHHRAATAH